MKKIIFEVEGMSCQHCVNAVTRAVEALAGVEQVTVDLAGKTVTVACGDTPPQLILAAIEEQGFSAKLA